MLNRALIGSTAPVIVNRAALHGAGIQLALTNGRAGTQTPVLMLGDSLAFSYGSNATNGLMRTSGLGNLIAANLVASGVKASAQGWLGDGQLHATGSARQYDSRISTGADGWGTGVNSLGGAAMVATSAATRTFTSGINCTAVELYYIQFGGGGHFTYSVDGGTAVDVNVNGGNAITKISVTGLALASHTITWAWVSGTVYVLGADCYDAATVGIKFINGAINGGMLSDFTANSAVWDPLKISATLLPKLAFLVIGANHWNTAASVTTFKTDLQTIITAFAAICPLILVADPASDPSGNAALSVQQPFVDAMRQLATANGLVMFDLWRYFGGINSRFNSDWLADHIHLSSTGYPKAASLITASML